MSQAIQPMSRDEYQLVIDRTNQASMEVAMRVDFTIADRVEELAREQPGKTFLVYEEQSISYGEVNRIADDYGRIALSRGVVQGDAVAKAKTQGQIQSLKRRTKHFEVKKDNTGELDFDARVSDESQKVDHQVTAGDLFFENGGLSFDGKKEGETFFSNSAGVATAPEIPTSEGEIQRDLTTEGLRSGDAAVTRNSIDAILNNSERTEGGERGEPALGALSLTRGFNANGVQNKRGLRASAMNGKDENGDGRLAFEAAGTRSSGSVGYAWGYDKDDGKTAVDNGDGVVDSGGLMVDAFEVDAFDALPGGSMTDARGKVAPAPQSDEKLDLAQQYRRTGRLDKARELLGKVLKEEPGNAAAKDGLATMDDPVRNNPALIDEDTKDVDGDELLDVLQTQKELVDQRLERMSQVVSERRDVAVDKALESHEYVDSKREYESAQQMLQSMKLQHSSKRISLKIPKQPITIHEKGQVETKSGGFLGLGRKKYEGRSTIQLKTTTPDMDPFGGQLGEDVGAPMTLQFYATEKEVIVADQTLKEVVDDLGLKDRWKTDEAGAIKRLKESVSTEQRKGTDLIDIKVEGKNATDAKMIAEEVAEKYQKRRAAMETERAERALGALDAELRDQEDLVEEKRKVLDTIVQTSGVAWVEGVAGSGEMGRSQNQNLLVVIEGGRRGAGAGTGPTPGQAQFLKHVGEVLAHGQGGAGHDRPVVRVQPEFPQYLARFQ